MSRQPGTDALVAALRDRRRNVSAFLFAVGVLAAATLVGSTAAYFAASLIVFTVWMVWFVLTCIEWVTRAEF
jgi:ABC-type siderophore export system fused ATPase/permease subunit